MSANLKNQFTISQEIEKEMVEYEISRAIDHFFVLTERRTEAEERKKITSSLVRIIRKFYGELTVEEVGEAIENGCCEQYGEFTNFDEAMKLIPRFLKAFKKDKEEERKKERTVVPLAEQEQNKVKQGKVMFENFGLLYVKGDIFFTEDKLFYEGSVINPYGFEKDQFNAYVNYIVKNSIFQEWYINSFDESSARQIVKERIVFEREMTSSKQETKGSINIQHVYKKLDPNDFSTWFENRCINIIAVHSYLSAKGTSFRTPSEFYKNPKKINY